MVAPPHIDGTTYSGLLFLALLTWGAACSPDPAARDPTALEATGDGFALEPSPALTIPRSDGDIILGMVVGATRLSGGTVAVLDRQMPGLLFFDSAGTLVRRVGRRGDGPGEFRMVEWVQQCAPDTLFISDGRTGLLSVLDSTGVVLRQHRFQRMPWRLSCNRQGALAVLAYPERVGISTADTAEYKTTLDYWSLTTGASLTVGQVAAGKSRPMSPLTTIAVGPAQVYVAPGDSSRVHVFDLAGKPLPPLVFDLPLRRASASHYEAAINRQVAPLTGAAERDYWRKQLLAIPPPEHLPAYRSVLSDPRGNAWVVASAFGDGYTEVHVITPKGGRLGVLRFPFELELFEIGESHILGYYEDPEGKPKVVLYRYSQKAAR